MPIGFQKPDLHPEGDASSHHRVSCNLRLKMKSTATRAAKKPPRTGWPGTCNHYSTYMLVSGDAPLCLEWLLWFGSLRVESAFPGRVDVPSEAHPDPLLSGHLEAFPCPVLSRCSAWWPPGATEGHSPGVALNPPQRRGAELALQRQW